MLLAENAQHARRLFYEIKPGAVLVDYMLGEDDGIKLGLEFQACVPTTRIVVMTGGGLADEELMLCRDREIPILFKPFLADEVMNLIRRPAFGSLAASVGSGGVGKIVDAA